MGSSSGSHFLGPVFDAQPRDATKVIDIVRDNGQIASQSCRSDEDVLDVDDLPARPQMRHGIASNDSLVETDVEDIHPAKDLVLDPGPEVAVIGSPHGAMTELHHADARGEEWVRGMLPQALGQARGRPTTHGMAEHVRVEQIQGYRGRRRGEDRPRGCP